VESGRSYYHSKDGRVAEEEIVVAWPFCLRVCGGHLMRSKSLFLPRGYSHQSLLFISGIIILIKMPVMEEV
jgi:hypothetical protein